MLPRLSWLVLCLSSSPLLWAAEVCVSVPAPGVPHGYRQAMAYELIFAAGQNQVPHPPAGTSWSSSTEVCLTDPVIQLGAVVTDATMLSQYAVRLVENRAQTTKEQQVLDELFSLNAQLATDDTTWDTLTTAQKLTVMKKLLRREVLKGRLER